MTAAYSLLKSAAALPQQLPGDKKTFVMDFSELVKGAQHVYQHGGIKQLLTLVPSKEEFWTSKTSTFLEVRSLAALLTLFEATLTFEHV